MNKLLTEIFNSFSDSSTPCALISPDGKFQKRNKPWTNAFTDKLSQNFFAALNLTDKKQESLRKLKRKTSLKASNRLYHISPVHSEGKLEGFVIVLDTGKETSLQNPDSGFAQFNYELYRIANYSELSAFAPEALKICADYFGCKDIYLLFTEKRLKEEFNYFHYLANFPAKENLDELLDRAVKKLNIWFAINTEPLELSKNDEHNINFRLFELSEAQHIIVCPVKFNEELLSIIIFSFDKPYVKMKELEEAAFYFSSSMAKHYLKRLHEKLEEQNLQLQRLENTGNLASGLAHDFNNLLSGIMHSSALLKNSVAGNEEALKYIDSIRGSLLRAGELAKNFQTFGKPAAKSRSLIHPQRIAEEAASALSQTLPENASLEISIDKELYEVLGNETEIYQAVLNLCLNAKDALGANGLIKIIVSNYKKESFTQELSFLTPGEYVKFTIEDNGSGIPKENLAKIFEPYYSTKEGKGTGLGLFMVYETVKSHKGFIDIDSELSRGTRFDLYFPAFSKNVSYDMQSKVILIADDDKDIRELLAELLESNNFEVITAESGEDALKVARERKHIDLFILDYKMPGMNGMDCAIRLREFNKDSALIISSGLSASVTDADIESLNINMVLTKPYDFDKMLTAINGILGKPTS